MRRVQPPIGSDWDDTARELGPEAAREILVSESAPPDPFDWLEDFELTDDEADQIADPEWIRGAEGFMPAGHVIAVAAKPGAGKTTIAFDLATRLPERGYTVVFVHADTNPADAKIMRERAVRAGVRYLTPDMKIGMGMADVVKNLKKLADSEADLTGHVWIFDTLKKMANVINKDSLKATLMLMRKLSARGMTCVLLCHTNKYKNADGEYQYEGTGDLESDSDELIYLEPFENPDGSLTVSTRCSKRRAAIDEITWRIYPDRSVTRETEYVDVAAIQREQAQREQDQDSIEVITAALTDGPAIQSQIIEHAKEHKIGKKTINAVLRRYTGKLWTCTPQFKDNAKRYELAEKSAPVAKGKTGQTEPRKWA